MIWIGVDPGGSGGITFQRCSAESYDRTVEAHKMPATERDLLDLLRGIRGIYGQPSFCVLEKVHSMPKQGVRSTFKFGQNFGMIRMALVAADIPFEEVTPVVWQKSMGVPSGKDKTRTEHLNDLKAKAQELFPHLKVTHAVAAAILLSEYARRKFEKGIPDSVPARLEVKGSRADFSEGQIEF